MPHQFNRLLARVLRLKGERVIITLGQAVDLIGRLPEFPNLRPVWHLACAAVRRAATTGSAEDIEAATCELELALLQDELLQSSDLPTPAPLRSGRAG